MDWLFLLRLYHVRLLLIAICDEPSDLREIVIILEWMPESMALLNFINLYITTAFMIVHLVVNIKACYKLYSVWAKKERMPEII